MSRLPKVYRTDSTCLRLTVVSNSQKYFVILQTRGDSSTTETKINHHL